MIHLTQRKIFKNRFSRFFYFSKISWAITFCAVLAAVFSFSAYASQKVQVKGDHAEVHLAPNWVSPILVTLPSGAAIPAGNRMLSDGQGGFWFKVLISNPGSKNTYGYVNANDVASDDVKSGLRAAGVEPMDAPVVEEKTPWIFALRVMGSGGALIKPMAAEFGGEAEFSACLLLGNTGYYRRMISFGPFVQFMGQFLTPAELTDTVVGGSIIFRLYTGTRVEPELRIRGGYGLTSGEGLAGLNFGVQIPFSLDPNFHVSGNLEAGSFYGFSPVQAVHVWASAGLGLHF